MMQGALRLIEHVLVDRLFTDRAPLTSFEKSGQVLCALSVFFALIGSGFLIYAAHLWLSGHYSPDTAAAMTGVLSFIFAAFVASIVYAAARYRQSRIKKIRKQVANTIKSTLSAMNDEWGDPIRENPKTAMLIGALAGFILEDQVF